MTDQPLQILAIDPSSTRTGYAMMAEAGPVLQVLGAGYVCPGKPTAPYLQRVEDMAKGVLDLINCADLGDPDRVIVEVPSGHVHGRIRDRQPQGLSVYGFGAGAIWWQLRRKLGDRVIGIDQNTWTRGTLKKARQASVMAHWPQYQSILAKDSGADAADAISLGAWWLHEQKVRSATP